MCWFFIYLFINLHYYIFWILQAQNRCIRFYNNMKVIVERPIFITVHKSDFLEWFFVDILGYSMQRHIIIVDLFY